MTKLGERPKIIGGSEAAATLSARGWLSRADPDFRAAMLGNGIVRRFPAGYVVGLAGEERGWMFGIASGSLEITAGDGAADAPLIHIGQAGLWAGFRPLLGETPRHITCVTREQSVILTIEQRAVERLLGDNPVWWREIARASDEASTLAVCAMADNLLRDPRRRTAAILLRLAAVRLESQGTEPLPVRASQDELASIVNVTRNTLSPILKDFSTGGLLTMGYRELSLADVPALQRIARGS